MPPNPHWSEHCQPAAHCAGCHRSQSQMLSNPHRHTQSCPQMVSNFPFVVTLISAAPVTEIAVQVRCKVWLPAGRIALTTARPPTPSLMWVIIFAQICITVILICWRQSGVRSMAKHSSHEPPKPDLSPRVVLVPRQSRPRRLLTECPAAPSLYLTATSLVADCVGTGRLVGISRSRFRYAELALDAEGHLTSACAPLPRCH